jgi:hypothetical protein
LIRENSKGGDKMERFKLISLVSGIILVVIVCFGFMLISGCATASKKAERSPFVETKQVISTAKIDSVKYFIKKGELNVEVSIKNVSDKVIFFFPMGLLAEVSIPKEEKQKRL